LATTAPERRISIAATLIKQTRGVVDLAARYGGEEFIIVMPEIDRSDVMSISERIRLAIEDCGIMAPPPRDIDGRGVVTASFGVATCDDAVGRLAVECACSPAALIKRADQCLTKPRRAVVTG
jgi:diguanylate cyclase (GGDEF)-like protein